MKLFDIILLSLATGFLIIGIGQTIYGKFIESYWIFMLSAAALIWYNMRKKKQSSEENPTIKNK